MGFFLKVLLFFAVVYMIMSFLGRFLFGAKRKNGAYTGRSQNREKAPETQEERILDYQKKNFESTDAVDVEFEEIKNEN